MTTYVNGANGCAAKIEKTDGGWMLTVADPSGNARTSAHKSEKAAFKAMLAFEHSWREVPEMPEEASGLCRRDALDAALRFLTRHGYGVAEVDWSCPAGTADIIAEADDVIVFAYVRTGDGPEPFAEIGRGLKRRQLESIAAAYLRDRVIGEVTVRFDVIDVHHLGGGRMFVRHHLGAYSGV